MIQIIFIAKNIIFLKLSRFESKNKKNKNQKSKENICKYWFLSFEKPKLSQKIYNQTLTKNVKTSDKFILIKFFKISESKSDPIAIT